MLRVIFGVTVHTLCDRAHTRVSLGFGHGFFSVSSFVGVGASPFHLSPLLVGFADCYNFVSLGFSRGVVAVSASFVVLCA